MRTLSAFNKVQIVFLELARMLLLIQKHTQNVING